MYWQFSILAVVCFVLSKFIYKDVNKYILLFFGIISLVNIIVGVILQNIDTETIEPIAIHNLIFVSIPVLTFCIGHFFWNKRRDTPH